MYGFDVAIEDSNSSLDAGYLNGPSTGSNSLVGTSSDDYMYGAGYKNLAYNFPIVVGTSNSASDTDYLYSPSTGSNTFYAKPDFAYMAGTGYTDVVDSIRGDRHFGIGERHGLPVRPFDRQQLVRVPADAVVHARQRLYERGE